MLDFKLYAMYTRIFRPRLIFTIYGAIVLQVFVYSIGVHYFREANASKLINPEQNRKDSSLDNNELVSATNRAAIGLDLSLAGTINPSAGAFQAPLAVVMAAPVVIEPEEKAPEVSFLRLEN